LTENEDPVLRKGFIAFRDVGHVIFFGVTADRRCGANTTVKEKLSTK
jgi:hypothetical protein